MKNKTTAIYFTHEHLFNVITYYILPLEMIYCLKQNKKKITYISKFRNVFSIIKVYAGEDERSLLYRVSQRSDCGGRERAYLYTFPHLSLSLNVMIGCWN